MHFILSLIVTLALSSASQAAFTRNQCQTGGVCVEFDPIVSHYCFRPLISNISTYTATTCNDPLLEPARAAHFVGSNSVAYYRILGSLLGGDFYRVNDSTNTIVCMSGIDIRTQCKLVTYCYYATGDDDFGTLVRDDNRPCFVSGGPTLVPSDNCYTRDALSRPCSAPTATLGPVASSTRTVTETQSSTPTSSPTSPPSVNPNPFVLTPAILGGIIAGGAGLLIIAITTFCCCRRRGYKKVPIQSDGYVVKYVTNKNHPIHKAIYAQEFTEKNGVTLLYNASDNRTARFIASHLEGNNMTVFPRSANIASRQDFKKLVENVHGSRHVVVLLSENFERSEDCKALSCFAADLGCGIFLAQIDSHRPTQDWTTEIMGAREAVDVNVVPELEELNELSRKVSQY